MSAERTGPPIEWRLANYAAQTASVVHGDYHPFLGELSRNNRLPLELLQQAEQIVGELLQETREAFSLNAQAAYGDDVTDAAEAALGGYLNLVLKRALLIGERDERSACAARIIRLCFTIMALNAARPWVQGIVADRNPDEIEGRIAATVIRIAVNLLAYRGRDLDKNVLGPIN